MINVHKVGNGSVVLIAGGGKTYCDLVSSFCKTDGSIDELIASPQNKKMIKELIECGHSSALKFDDFVFCIRGYARISELQVVHECIDGHVIDDSFENINKNHSIDVVVPNNIRNFRAKRIINPERLIVKFSNPNNVAQIKLSDCFPLMRQQFAQSANPTVIYEYDYKDILDLIDSWYTEGSIQNIPEEDLCYMKPQAIEFRAVIKINAKNLREWACTRMCNCAPFEIRDLANKMVRLAKNAAPDLMENVGPSCVVHGFCQEVSQCKQFKGKIPTKQQVINYINNHKQEILNG